MARGTWIVLLTIKVVTCIRGRSEHHSQQKKIDNTQDSQLVPHATTNRAFKCLTSEIERDQVLSQENGRQLIPEREFCLI